MSFLSTRRILSWARGWAYLVSNAYLPPRRPSGRQRFNVLGALHAITHEIITVTNDTYINSESVVTLFGKKFTDLPITVVLDNAPYQRNAFVMAEAERLPITLLWLPTYSPRGFPPSFKGRMSENSWGLLWQFTGIAIGNYW